MAGKIPHVLLYAAGLGAAWLAEQNGSNAQFLILALGVPIAALTSTRKSTPSTATLWLWGILALMLLPASTVRLYPVLYAYLPGFGTSFPPTRFLFVLALAALFAGFRRWDPGRLRAWHFGLLFLWITICAARSFEIYKRLGYGYDLAHVLNLLDNTLQGRFLFSDYTNASILSHHLYLTLPLLAPLYFFVHSPYLPQAVQILLMAASAIILPWGITKRFGKDAGMAAFFTFLMHPAFQGQILHEFDPGVIGLFAVSLAILGFCDHSPPLFWTGCIGAVLSKEHFAAAMIVIGIVMIVTDQGRREGKIMVGGAFALLLVFILYSLLSPGTFNLKSQWELRTGGSIMTLITEVFRPAKIGYVVHMFLPSGGLAFLAWPVVLAALPELAINVVSRFPMNQLASHYSTVSLPLLALASSLAVARCASRDHELGRWAAKYVICASVGAALFSNLGPISHSLAFYDVLMTERDWKFRYLDSMIARIPPGTVGIRGSHRLLIYFSRRRPAIDLSYINSREMVESRDFLVLDEYYGGPPDGYTLLESEGRTFVYEKTRVEKAQ